MVRYKCYAFLTWWQYWFLPWLDISVEDVKTYMEARPTPNKAGSIELPMTSRIEITPFDRDSRSSDDDDPTLIMIQ